METNGKLPADERIVTVRSVAIAQLLDDADARAQRRWST
jgi:hypothetical protein